MKSAATSAAWCDANQAYLVAEFSRLKLRLGAEHDERVVAARVEAAHASLPAPAAIDTLTELFGLSAFERDLLLLVAGVEMDAELGRVCAAALGQSQAPRPQATFALALAALDQSHWSALAAMGPLRRWRLLEVDDSAGLVNGRLRIDERVLHYLAGVNYLDPRLQPLLSLVPAPQVMAETHRHVCQAVLERLRERSSSYPVVLLSGDDVDGQADVAAAVAAHLQVKLYCGQADDLPSHATEADAFAILWQREAALLGAVLLIHCHDGAPSKAVGHLAERGSSPLFIAGRDVPSSKRATIRYSVNKPDGAEQKQLWEQVLGPATMRMNRTLDGVSSQFSLSARAILTAGAGLRDVAESGSEANSALWNACRSVSRSRLDDLAQHLDPVAGWNDLVLPEAQLRTLRQIAAHAKHRLKVYQQWGFAGKGMRGLGISALFAGESGTGKTMAAEVLAKELHLDLYRIDLSGVVSKYIGETERNLRRVFDAAETSGAMLLFDEADALFGKRSEVRDSHDRYANIEVSYLLQRMEAYRGLAVLTTNMKAALDVAFSRRLSFVVQFPFPDQHQRELIWRRIFPAATPVEPLDYAKLARLSMSGGNIRSIALNAAFLAADEGAAVGMRHLLQAAHTEAAKRERPLSDAETRGWV
ncbi:MAG: AAA family ATPase [Nitrospira sp. CR2.1]|nr:AAA family ATPase [Nitrospira sp. CR2.1]